MLPDIKISRQSMLLCRDIIQSTMMASQKIALQRRSRLMKCSTYICMPALSWHHYSLYINFLLCHPKAGRQTFYKSVNY